METTQKGGGRLQNGSIVAKMPNRLKLVQSDENDKVTSEKSAEMDPYTELELYLAKVKVSQCWIRTFIFLAFNYQKLEGWSQEVEELLNYYKRNTYKGKIK